MTPSPSAHHRLLSSTAEEEESLDDLLHMTGFTAAAEDEQMAQCCGAKILFKKKNKYAYVAGFSLAGLVVSLSIVALFLGKISSYSSTSPLDGNSDYYRSQGRRNVILMVSDGFGPASETLARNYYTHIHSLPFGSQLPLDTILVGASRTRSSSSLVTDSAAGATAFSCALKTYNGAIGVDPQQRPCGTVLEAAKLEGYMTALVATSRITHATPASFNSHVSHRDFENDIAVQQTLGFHPVLGGRTVDIMMGGGRCHFLPLSSGGGVGSCRKDDRDLVAEGRAKMNWTVATTRKEFDAIENVNQVDLPLMFLFTPDHMSYEIDRDPSVEPSLKEMAAKTLSILAEKTAQSNKGFFVMIEGSRIDMAAHSQDPATHVREILAYQDTIAHVKEFVDAHPNTVMISVSDHETGGVSVARQVGSAYPEYRWNPEALKPVTSSIDALSWKITDFKKHHNLTSGADAANSAEYQHFIQEVIVKIGLGIQDANGLELADLYKNDYLNDLLADMVSRRAELGWATHGHSAVDVNLYAYSNGAKDAHLKLAGNKENTDIGDFIAKYLALDLPALTKKIISSGSGVSGGGGGGGATIASSNEALNHFHSDRMKENKQPSSQ